MEIVHVIQNIGSQKLEKFGETYFFLYSKWKEYNTIYMKSSATGGKERENEHLSNNEKMLRNYFLRDYSHLTVNKYQDMLKKALIYCKIACNLNYIVF